MAVGMNKMANVAAIVALALAGAWLAGCENDRDIPLRAVPGSIEDPRFPRTAATTVPIAGSTGGAGGGGAATYTTRLGVVLPLTCPPDPANCDPAVFKCQQDAQDFFSALAAATGQADCAGLDGNPANGLACDSVLPAACTP